MSFVEVNVPVDQCKNHDSEPPCSAKVLENRASISSVDSSISLSYDAAPFTPRGSITTSSGTDDEKPTVANSSSAAEISSDGCARKISKNSGDPQNPFQPPDDELTKKIIDQVEYYFGDENIVKDAFLLKHVRRNKEGYVSLKLVASFKRIKHIARDWRVVRAALEKSTKLRINETGTKLCRKDPLPLYDQTTPSRTVVALNIPPHKATIESVAEMFRTCGEIALVRILRPGNPVPADVRPFYNKHPQMQDAVSALVEFVRTESAHNALNREWPPLHSDVQVLELNAPPARKKKFLNKNITDTEFSSSCQSGSEVEDRYKLRLQQRKGSLPVQTHKWAQRRWSKDSETDSSSSYCRSKSNSGVYFIPDHRRPSTGWESSSDSYGSCRSRSNSGVSIPEVFQMRRYSVPRNESAAAAGCCCCAFPKCEIAVAGRRYSMGRGCEEYNSAQSISRCSSREMCDGAAVCRRDSIPELYSARGSSCERRNSMTRPEGQWSRSNGLSSSSNSGRHVSSDDGRLGPVRHKSFINVPGLPGSSDMVVRLPRGPDGGRGFQREIIECTLPE